MCPRGFPRVCVERGGTMGVSDEEEMDAGRPTLFGSSYTGCGANWNDSGCIPEAIEHEIGREREYMQH